MVDIGRFHTRDGLSVWANIMCVDLLRERVMQNQN